MRDQVASAPGARCGGWGASTWRWGSCTGAPRGMRRCRSARSGTAWPPCTSRCSLVIFCKHELRKAVPIYRI